MAPWVENHSSSMAWVSRSGKPQVSSAAHGLLLRIAQAFFASCGGRRATISRATFAVIAGWLRSCRCETGAPHGLCQSLSNHLAVLGWRLHRGRFFEHVVADLALGLAWVQPPRVQRCRFPRVAHHRAGVRSPILHLWVRPPGPQGGQQLLVYLLPRPLPRRLGLALGPRWWPERP